MVRLIEGRDSELAGGGRFIDGRIWMPCPHPMGGLPRPSVLVSTLEPGVAAPTRGVDTPSIVGSLHGSSDAAIVVTIPRLASRPVSIH